MGGKPPAKYKEPYKNRLMKGGGSAYKQCLGTGPGGQAEWYTESSKVKGFLKIAVLRKLTDGFIRKFNYAFLLRWLTRPSGFPVAVTWSFISIPPQTARCPSDIPQQRAAKLSSSYCLVLVQLYDTKKRWIFVRGDEVVGHGRYHHF